MGGEGGERRSHARGRPAMATTTVGVATFVVGPIALVRPVRALGIDHGGRALVVAVVG